MGIKFDLTFWILTVGMNGQKGQEGEVAVFFLPRRNSVYKWPLFNVNIWGCFGITVYAQTTCSEGRVFFFLNMYVYFKSCSSRGDSAVRGDHSQRSADDPAFFPGWEAKGHGGRGGLYAAELSQRKWLSYKAGGSAFSCTPVLSVDWSETSVTLSKFVPLGHNLTFTD